MSNPRISFDSEQLDQASRRLRDTIQTMGAHLGDEQCRDALSLALFNRPHREAFQTDRPLQRATSVERDRDSDPDHDNEAPGCVIVSVVAFDIEYDLDAEPATDSTDQQRCCPPEIYFAFDQYEVGYSVGDVCDEIIMDRLRDAIPRYTGTPVKCFDFDWVGIGPASGEYCDIHILNCGPNMILTASGNYVMGHFPGTETAPGAVDLRSHAASVARYGLHESPYGAIREITLPQVVDDPTDPSQLLALAHDLDVLSNEDAPYGDFVDVTARILAPEDTSRLSVSDQSVGGEYHLRVDLRHAPIELAPAAASGWLDTHVAIDDPASFTYMVTLDSENESASRWHHMEDRDYRLDQLVVPL